MYCLVASGCGLALECDPEKADWPLLELTYVNNLTRVEASNMNCRRYQTSDPHRPHPFGRLLHAACENHSFPKWAELNGSKSRLKLRNQVVGQHVANSDHVVVSVITLKKRQEWQECDLWNTCSVSHLIIHHLIWSHLISFDLIHSCHFNPFQSTWTTTVLPLERWLTNPQ